MRPALPASDSKNCGSDGEPNATMVLQGENHHGSRFPATITPPPDRRAKNRSTDGTGLSDNSQCGKLSRPEAIVCNCSL